VTRSSAPPRERPAPAAGTAGHRASTPRQRWSRFASRYGWRAYALPLLAVVTVLALVTTTNGSVRAAVDDQVTGGSPAQRAAAPPRAASTAQLKVDTPGSNAVTSAMSSTQLPPGPKYTTTGAGTFRRIPGSSPVIGRGTLFRFDVEVENGIQGVDLAQFASVVMSSLSDHRSWTGTGQLALQRVASGAVDFHVALTSSMTVRRFCGYDLPIETSCFDASHRLVVLNVARWVRGAQVYASDLATYRIYAVNHEVGHALGHNHAHDCLKNGLAPAMMQQTIGSRTASGRICQANPWPYPPGVPDAPGAEQSGDGPDMAFYQRNSG